MKNLRFYLPILTTLLLCCLLAALGVVTQLAHYNEFADHSTFCRIPHAADVLSNLAFALVSLWGMLRLWPQRSHPSLRAGRHGYALFLIGLLLTAVGSTYYHWAPDNLRLVWDRLPIGLTCAGLLAAVRAENVPQATCGRDAVWLAIFAVGGVIWWHIGDRQGHGDLRPYLLLQALTLILIPMWQAIYRAPKAERAAFGCALLLYVLAKTAETYDHQLLAVLGFVSGHTLKHLLAACAAGVVLAYLIRRTRQPECRQAVGARRPISWPLS